MEQIVEGIRMSGRFIIDKFHDPDQLVHRNAHLTTEELQKMFPGRHYEHTELPNTALNEGLQKLIELICGISAPTAWNSANARIGVGNDNTAPSATQTGLIGASTAFKAMEATYPSRSGQVATWKSSFGDTEGEFAWEEFTIDNGATEDINLSRVTASKGTKTSGETWTVTYEITFS